VRFAKTASATAFTGRVEPLLHTLVMQLVRLPEDKSDPAKAEQARIEMIDVLARLTEVVALGGSLRPGKVTPYRAAQLAARRSCPGRQADVSAVAAAP